MPGLDSALTVALLTGLSCRNPFAWQFYFLTLLSGNLLAVAVILIDPYSAPFTLPVLLIYVGLLYLWRRPKILRYFKQPHYFV